MSWKDRFTFRDKRYIEHEVAGETFRFYPNRMALLTEARDLSAPVAKAISVLFADQSRDSSSRVKRMKDASAQGGEMEEVDTDAISIEMATHRQAERERAMDEIFHTIADERSKLLLGRLFMDSLRDEFPYRKSRSAREVEEFLYGEEPSEESPEPSYTGLDVPALIQMFSGWMKANAKVFGETGEKMVGLVQRRLEEATGESSSDLTGPTSGFSSKSHTSPQSPTASAPTS